MTVNPTDQDCYLAYKTASGEVNRLIPCLTNTAYCFDSVSLDVFLDWRYLLDFATACKDEDIYIHAIDPATLRGKDKQGNHAVLFKAATVSYVVMPLSRDRK